MKRILFQIIVVTGLLLTSCKSTPNQIIDEKSDSNSAGHCIAPIVDFVFPDYDETKIYNYPDVLPNNDWEKVFTFPENEEYSFPSIQITRKYDSHDEIWLVGSDEELIRFRTDTLKWQIYNSIFEKNPLPDSSRYQLFLDNNNNIWVIRDTDQGEFPILGRFNDTNGKFEEVFDNNHLLNTRRYAWSIKVDHNNFFWLLMYEDNSILGLYSYDPKTNLAEQHLLEEGLASTIEIGPDNSIFLVDLDNAQLVNYIQADQTIKKYIIRENGDLDEAHGASLQFDSSGRLWVSDHGWFDFSPESIDHTWYTIIRSPIFIYYNPTNGTHKWSRPVLKVEDSNGLLWFCGTSSIASLNITNGEWCKITTYYSNIVEDSQNNLWIIIDNTLYKY